jgi:hypothetical protein
VDAKAGELRMNKGFLIWTGNEPEKPGTSFAAQEKRMLQ